jgi:hypothetical protein
MTTHSTRIGEDGGLWLIGFRTSLEADMANFYVLFIHNAKDRPLQVNGKIVLFDNPSLAPRALAQAEPAVRELGPAPEDPDLICDVVESLRLIGAENMDPSATIINFLNVLLDMVAATKVPVPPGHKRALWSFADHLTFQREYGDFFGEANVTRDDVQRAVLWCLDTVMAHAVKLA